VTSVAALALASTNGAGSSTPALEVNASNDQGQGSFSRVLSQQTGSVTTEDATSASQTPTSAKPSTDTATATPASNDAKGAGDPSTPLAPTPGTKDRASRVDSSKSKATTPAPGNASAGKRMKRTDNATSDAGAVGVGTAAVPTDNASVHTKGGPLTGQNAPSRVAMDRMSSASTDTHPSVESQPTSPAPTSLATASADGEFTSNSPHASSSVEKRPANSLAAGADALGGSRAAVISPSDSPLASLPTHSAVVNGHSPSSTAILHSAGADRANRKAPDAAGGLAALGANASPGSLGTGNEAAGATQTNAANPSATNPSVAHGASHSVDSVANLPSRSLVSGLMNQATAGFDVGGLSSNLSRPLSQGNGTYSISVAMQPASLGHVHALMSLSGNDLHVSLTPDASVAHAALSNAINDLKSELGSSGLNVSVDLHHSQSQASNEGWRPPPPENSTRFETPIPSASTLPASVDAAGLIHVLL